MNHFNKLNDNKPYAMNVVFHSYYFQSFATLSNFNIVEDGLYSGDTRDVLSVYHTFYVNSTMPTIIFDKRDILEI